MGRIASLVAAICGRIMAECASGHARYACHAGDARRAVLLGDRLSLSTARSWRPRSRRSTTRDVTPAHTFNDGQNYHPTNKWVLFGHHFAAISGAGPLIGPVLAIQFGYLPGLLWLVVGVCLAGAVQDMLVLAAVGAPRRQIAGRDRPHRDRPAGRRHRVARDPVHRRHRPGRAGLRGRQGAGRRGGQAGRGHRVRYCRRRSTRDCRPRRRHAITPRSRRHADHVPRTAAKSRAARRSPSTTAEPTPGCQRLRS